MGSRGDYYRAAAGLLGNALHFRYARLRGAPLKPEALSLCLTHRCNSHCLMCRIWKQAGEEPGIRSLEVSRAEIMALLSRPLFSGLVELDLTGGEPHLRDDLVEIALGTGALKETSLPRLRSIVITSNGLLPEKIISNYQRILEGLKGTGVDLVSVASIDGIGETHDVIRGTKGAFARATLTLNGLKELRNRYPGYYIGIKTTILPQNYRVLDAILDFALEHNYFPIISPVFFTKTRFGNLDTREALGLGPGAYQEVLKLYRREELASHYFYSRAQSFLATGRRCWSCTAAYNYMFIEFDGTVYPCELLAEPIGNVRKQALEDIWKGAPARDWRKRIGNLECCRECVEPGAIRYSACTEGLGYFRFLRALGRHHYGESFYGEGFSKYFGR